MSEEQQTVANETNTDATPSAEENGAQEREKSVDELLAEFDEPDEKPKPSQESSESKIKLDEKQRKEIMEGLRSEMQIESELEKTIADIKGDLDVESEYVRWKLEDMATKDDRIWKAFVARNSKPAAWQKIVSDVKKDLGSRYGKSVGTDKEKIASAVRSATKSSSSSSGDNLDIKKMSDAEFEYNKEKLFAQAMKG